MKIQKNKFFLGGWGVGSREVGLGGGQGGCDRRIEVFGKIYIFFFFFFLGGGGRVGRGGQGGCDRKFEVFGKIQKKNLFLFFFGGSGSGWGGVRVDVIEELKCLGKFTKKEFGGWGDGRGHVGGSGWM